MWVFVVLYETKKAAKQAAVSLFTVYITINITDALWTSATRGIHSVSALSLLLSFPSHNLLSEIS